MPPVRLVVTAISLAMSAGRHPLVRAGIRAAAPHVLNPRNRERAAETAKTAAYNAGVLVRRLTRRDSR